MPREREGFMDQYRVLSDRFGGREVITLNESCELLGLDRRALLVHTSSLKQPLKQRPFMMRLSPESKP